MKTVDRGAALLDERKPGWERKIDLETLDLAKGCNCILGQLYGDRLTAADYDGFARGSRLLGLDIQDERSFGFMRAPRGYWSNLTAAWRKLIEERRS